MNKPSVLVVDDESGILDTLRILLRNEGFEVTTATVDDSQRCAAITADEQVSGRIGTDPKLDGQLRGGAHRRPGDAVAVGVGPFAEPVAQLLPFRAVQAHPPRLHFLGG